MRNTRELPQQASTLRRRVQPFAKPPALVKAEATEPNLMVGIERETLSDKSFGCLDA
ncbi:hypothetical protein [Methylobacterium segetis]|uniref:hypothetical protein n=1 Tax=Methylobacterium segetis TaxID=2488750 RepID=UPI0014052877|nr:hypothetical protein [Methylobacterium segetis]